MNDAKYIGMDVHQATICAAVRDSSGNLVMEATLETKAETILEFVHGLRGSLRVSFEEGTCAAWLHDLLKPHVSEVLVCDSRKNALLALRQEARRELLAEARKHPALRLLRKIPAIGPIRAALLIVLMQTPHRFRTKRQLWAYCGLALRTYDSGEYRFVGGQLKRSKKG